jgi:CHRD domain
MLRSRYSFPALALLSLAGCGGAAVSDSTGPVDERFSATLAGTSVVPATTSTSAGTLTLEARDSTLGFSLSITNMTGVTQAHLHSAAAGANGATLVWLLPVNGNNAQTPSVTLDGVISLGDIAPSWVRGSPRLAMDSVKALMRAGKVYVDVHTSAFTNGEVRGQIAKMP